MFVHPQRDPWRGFLARKSYHSQRTERLWRNVFTSSLSKFYCIFWYLKDADLLNIGDELKLFVWRLVFTQRINKDLL